jgi:hypothetical protein
VLIAANVALFVWYQRYPVPPPAERVLRPLPAYTDRLVLLAERDTRAVETQPVEPVQADAAEQAQAVPPEVGGPAPSAVALAAESNVDATAEPPPVALEPVCETLGPIREQGAAQSIAKQLSEQGYQARVRAGEARVPAGYWVYLPAMPAREARRIAADLDANGMKDYYIGKRNYISLGIFSKSSKAETRQKRIQKLGYKPVLAPRYRNRSAYWLDTEARGQALADSRLWLDIEDKLGEIKLEQIDCE